MITNTFNQCLVGLGGLDNVFLGPKHRKIGLEKHLFLHTFLTSIFVCCVWLPWTALAILVVINNDEGDHLQTNVVSTLQCPCGTSES